MNHRLKNNSVVASFRPNLIHHFLEHSAIRYPNKAAILHNGKTYSYEKVNDLSNRLAGFLKELGIKPNTPIALLFNNSIEYVVGYYGILKAGQIVSPLNTGLTTEGLAKIITDLSPEVIIASSRFEKLLYTSISKTREIRHVILDSTAMDWSKIPVTIHNWMDKIVLSNGKWTQGGYQDECQTAVVTYTSGTASNPKGVALTHKNVVSNTLSICQFLDLTCKDTQMVVLPFFYVMGKSLLNSHFAVGGKVVINNKFAYSAAVIQQMVEEKVTGFSGVPSTYSHLIHRSPLAHYRDKLTALRYCTQAGGAMAKQLKVNLRKVLPVHTKIYIMYGATEATARISYLHPDKYLEKMGSIGKPVDHVELKVMDEKGNDVSDGAVGELVATGPNIMKGYWRDEVKTLSVLDKNGYHTGDLGYRDEDGFFFLVGRKDGMIKTGGHRVNPLEIEEILLETEIVIEAFVFGVPDTMLGNKIVALAVPKVSSCSENQVLKECVKIAPRYKVPSCIKLVQAIPKLSNGKIDSTKSKSLFHNKRNAYHAD